MVEIGTIDQIRNFPIGSIILIDGQIVEIIGMHDIHRRIVPVRHVDNFIEDSVTSTAKVPLIARSYQEYIQFKLPRREDQIINPIHTPYINLPMPTLHLQSSVGIAIAIIMVFFIIFRR